MSYTKTTWVNNQAPAINADNLNHMEQGIESAHNQIDINTSDIDSLETQTQNNTQNIATETSTRQSQDSLLQSQIDQLVAPTGEAPTPAEIENARIGDDGVTYDTLGNAIRTQFSNVKSALTHKIEDIADAEKLEFVSIPLNMEIGGLYENGYPMDSTNRVRMVYYAPVDLASAKIIYPEGTKHRVCYYNGFARLGLVMTNWSSLTEEEIIFPDVNDTSIPLMFKILLGYTDDREITGANIPIPKIEYFYNKNNGVPFVNGYYPQYGNEPSIRGYNTVYNLSAIIPVKPSTTYRANKFRVTLLFDEDMQFVRSLAPASLANNLLTTASDERYVMYCWKTTDCDKAYFEEVDDYVGGAEIENLVPISLKGKYLSLLGDSISAYAGTIPSGNDVYYTGANSGMDSPSQMWWSVLCDKLGLKPLVINGYSGSAVTQLEDSAHIAKVPMSSDARCAALHSGTTNPDIIIIAGGVNDYTYALSAQSEPLEWDGLTAPTLGNSFTEAYACMIKKLQTNYPNAIVVCLSTWFTMRGDDNGYTLTHTVGSHKYTQADYNKAIEHVAKQMHVPFIDVSNIGFNRNNFYPTYAEDSSTIPTHPNKVGQGVMGRAIANKLPELVKAYLK